MSDDNVKEVEIGPLCVSFSDDPFCEDLSEMFGEFVETEGPPDVRISGRPLNKDSPPTSAPVRASDEISIGDSSVVIDETRSGKGVLKSTLFEYIGDRFSRVMQITRDRQSDLDIEVYYDSPLYEGNLSPLQHYLRWSDWTYEPWHRAFAKSFVYNRLEPLLQVELLRRDATFIHAGAVAIDGDGIVFTGAGGSGKTSTTSALLRSHDDTKFLSDDLAILDAGGSVYSYPKTAVVYPYNIGESGIREDEILTGPLDRFHWNIRQKRHGQKGVRRRVKPERLYSGQVPDRAEFVLDTAVFLVREHRDSITHETVSATELAERSTSVIVDELGWLSDYKSTVHAADPSTQSLSELLVDIETTYERAFEGTNGFVLSVPFDATPSDLSEYVWSKFV